MFSRFALAAALTIAASSTLFAADSSRTLWNGTGTGGVGVAGAEIKARQGSATAHGSYFSEAGLVAPGDSVSRTRYGIGASYAPIEYAEAGLNASGTAVRNSLSNPESLHSFGDFVAAVKGAYPVQDWLWTGLRGELRLFAGVDGQSGYGDTASYAGSWVSTARFGNLAAHLQVGYLYDRTVNFVSVAPTPAERFAWGQNDFNQLLLGASVNYETGFADYILEASGAKPVGADAPGFGESPIKLTPGVRLRPWGPLELQLAADISLTGEAGAGLPAQPGYDLLAGMRYVFDVGAEPEAEEAPAETGPAAAPVVPPPPAPAPEETAPSITTAPAEQPAALGTLAGRVVSLATGEPIAGATVRIEGTSLSAKTSASGSYLIPGIAAGEATVVVEAREMQTQTVRGDVKPGGMTTMDIGLQPVVTKGTLVVKVVDGSGKAIAGADVLVNGAKGGTTGPEGSVQLKELEAGMMKVGASKSGFISPEPAFVEVNAGQTSTETLTLQPEPRPGFVEVKAVNEERQPIAATVTVEGHPDWTRQLEPAGGSVTTLKLPPGTYRVRVEANGYLPEVQQVDVSEDDEEALRFKLRKAP